MHIVWEDRLQLVKHLSWRILPIVSPSHCHRIINNVLCNSFLRAGWNYKHWNPVTQDTAQLTAMAKNNNETSGEFLSARERNVFFLFCFSFFPIRAGRWSERFHLLLLTSTEAKPPALQTNIPHTLTHTIYCCQTKGLDSMFVWVTVHHWYNNTGCSTRYRTGHFFNNSNNIQNIATKF